MANFKKSALWKGAPFMIQLLKIFIVLIPLTAGAADLNRGLRYCEELEQSQMPASKVFQKNYIQSYINMTSECTASVSERSSFYTRLLNQISSLENNTHSLDLLETSTRLILENIKTPSAEEISSNAVSFQFNPQNNNNNGGFFLQPARHSRSISIPGYPTVEKTSKTLLDHDFEVTSIVTVFYSPAFICVETPSYKNLLQPLLRWMEQQIKKFQASLALYDSFFIMSLSMVDFNTPEELPSAFPYRNFPHNINARQIEHYLQLYEEIKDEYSDEFNAVFAGEFLHPYLRRLKIKEQVDKKILEFCQTNEIKFQKPFEQTHTIYSLISSDLKLEERKKMLERLKNHFLKKYAEQNTAAYSASIDPSAWTMHLTALK